MKTIIMTSTGKVQIIVTCNMQKTVPEETLKFKCTTHPGLVIWNDLYIGDLSLRVITSYRINVLG